MRITNRLSKSGSESACAASTSDDFSDEGARASRKKASLHWSLGVLFCVAIGAPVTAQESAELEGDTAAAETPAEDERTNGEATQVVNAGGETDPSDPAQVENVSFTSMHPHSVAMTEIHNEYRTQAGLSAQTVDPDLSRLAQRWAEHMASVGSMYHGGGEQIIAYSGGDRSYDAGFRLWLNSSPHRAWLYSRSDRCGFGYSVGRNGCAYYAGAFGSASDRTYSSSSSGGEYYASHSSSSNSGRRLRWFRRRS